MANVDCVHLISAQEAARLLGMHVGSITRLARQGRIPGYKIGHLWRFDLEEVKETLGNGKEQAASFLARKAH